MLRKTLTLAFVISLVGSGANTTYPQPPENGKAKSDKEARTPLKKCWDHTFSPGSGRFVVGSDDKIFISESNGNLRAISAVTNETIWMTELGGSIEALMAISGVGVVAVTNSVDSNSVSQTNLRLLEGNTGLSKYSSPVTVGKVIFLKSAGSRLIAFTASGEFETFDLNSGQKVWKAKTRNPISAEPANFENIIAIPTAGKKLEVFSINDGSMTGSIPIQREITVIGFRENQMLLTGDDRGNVTNYRDQQGLIWWKFKSGGRIGTITETSEGIMVGSYDNFVYMISKYSGDVRWKVRLEGRVVFRPLVVGSEAYFTVSGQDELVIINTESGKIIERSSFGTDRFPIANPIVATGNIKVFPIVGGLQAFTSNGCK